MGKWFKMVKHYDDIILCATMSVPQVFYQAGILLEGRLLKWRMSGSGKFSETIFPLCVFFCWKAYLKSSPPHQEEAGKKQVGASEIVAQAMFLILLLMPAHTVVKVLLMPPPDSKWTEPTM